jgi:hypothetical protein
MTSLALRALGTAVRSVAHGLLTDAVITIENNLVILRVPLAGLRLFWPPDKARAVAASLVRMAERVERFRVIETGVAE